MSTLQRTLTIIFLVLIVLVSLSIGGLLAYQYGWLPWSVNPEIEPTNVRITNLSPDHVSISWSTQIASTGVVHYGNTEALGKTQADDRDSTGSPQARQLHHVTLANLQPNTQYFFEIQSGETRRLFDDQGRPYTVKTATALGALPPADLINGLVNRSGDKPAEGAIIYLSLDGAAPLSTLVKTDGSWLVNLASAFKIDGSSYATYDPESTPLTLTVVSPTAKSQVKTITANDSPVPTITLGQNYDFTSTTSPSKVLPSPKVASVSAQPSTSTAASKFNVGSVTRIPDIMVADSTTDKEVQILNPDENYETLYTARPAFLGKGPVGKVLTIRIASTQEIQGTTSVDSQGDWSYSPTQDLTPATYTLQVDFVNSKNLEDSVQKIFVIASGVNQGTSTYPAFEATPSATITPTALPTAQPTPEPTRVTMPSTSSGVPVSGSTHPTLYLVLLGAVLLSFGFYHKMSSAHD